MATIQTVDNFKADFIQEASNKSFSAGALNSNWFIKSSSQVSGLNITLESYQKNKNNIFFSFFDKDEDKKEAKNSDDLILSINKNFDGSYMAQCGNYIGKFKYDRHDIDIKSRFGNKFLERMLNFTNDVYIDDVSIVGENIKKDEIDYSKYIIYYLFVQSLEKAYLLGLPKAYKSIKHHESTLKGRIDINEYIKKDIPFRGKISSISREQQEIQEIVDVLHKTIKIIGKEYGTGNKKTATYKSFLKNISHIVPHLKEQKSNHRVTNEIINKALNSKALQNPIFAPYKKVLRYAKYIINADSIKENKDGKQETFGFLVNAAELFEIYITKLLQKEFSDWSIESPKIELYSSQFFARKIIPDIVMIKDNNVMIFDTKYKKMNMQGKNKNGAGDVDRNDFFQINTYMSYYQNQGCNVKVGGLLYPMEAFEKEKCHSETWFGNNKTKFIIDGIDLSNLEKDSESKFAPISKREQKFIDGIKALLN